jgi:hypothetical protein
MSEWNSNDGLIEAGEKTKAEGLETAENRDACSRISVQ